MSENRKFKLKYEELRENNPMGDQPQSSDKPERREDKNYAHPGNNRNLAFAWPDGRIESFNYAYLVSAKFEHGDDQNTIIITFTSHSVTIKGYCLQTLFWDVFNNLPRIIECTDTRYVDVAYKAELFIADIRVTPET